MPSFNTTSGPNSTIGFNATTGFNATDGLNTTTISPASSTRDGLPLHPRLTPAFGVAGALLILTGCAYACASIKIMRLYMFLSCAYLASICITVLIVYVMSVPDGNVSDGVQGAYLVATVLPGIVLGGVLSQYVQWLAKRSGCIVGGFCIAMWIEVLSPGGVITSSSMLALFIALMCLAALAPSFLKKTKEPAYMVCSAFSGITALVLGIDCYSRAGLKELWVYTWHFHRVKLFGFGTTTYPLTRGIKAEIGMIPVFFALAMVFQGKFFKPIRKQKESQAAVDAVLREEHERKELDTGRAIQEDVGRERAAWEERYREPGKKKPDVEQRQVYPPPPSKPGHKLHNAASFILDKFKPDTRNLSTTKDRGQHPDEIRPVETSIENTEAATDDPQTRRPQSPRRYPSLRPTSCPPPPIVPQTDYECDTSSDGRVSSLELALDMEDRARHVVPDQDATEIEPSIQLSNQHENKQNSLTTIKLSRPNLADCEQHTTEQPLEEDETNEQHQPPPDQGDTNEPLQYAHLEPKKLDLAEVLNDHVHDGPLTHISAFAAVNRDEIMNRTREWRKAVVQTELNSRPSSTHSYDANNEPSAWSEFEGTHATDNTSQRLESQETAAPQPLQHDSSRGSAIEQNKRRSRRVSVIEGKTAILPAPVKSARVKKRNSSLPMLNTGSTLLDDRTTIAQHRKKQVSLTNNFLGNENQGEVARRSFGSHGKFTNGNSNNVESTDLDEITLSQARAALHARSVSNSQVSTTSSHPPRASSTQLTPLDLHSYYYFVALTTTNMEKECIMHSSNFFGFSPHHMIVWHVGTQYSIRISLDALVGTEFHSTYNGLLAKLNDKDEDGLPKNSPFEIFEALQGLVWKTCISVSEAYANTESLRLESLQDYVKPHTIHIAMIKDARGEGGVVAKVVGDVSSNYPWSTARTAQTNNHITNSYGWDTAPIPNQDLKLGHMVQIFQASELFITKKATKAGPMQQVHTITGTQYFFKPRSDHMAPEFDREVSVLGEIISYGLDRTLKVSPLKGMVLLDNSIVAGMLFEWLEGSPLAENPGLSNPIFHKHWQEQVEAIVKELHRHKIVWGDVNVHNIFIDTNADAWVIDFGGNCNVQFIDEEL
ncbi:hypothetical protein KCU75_g4835, partial [Aureobasidium melanogenum]